MMAMGDTGAGRRSGKEKLYIDRDQLQPINILALSGCPALTIETGPELLRPTS